MQDADFFRFAQEKISTEFVAANNPNVFSVSVYHRASVSLYLGFNAIDDRNG